MVIKQHRGGKKHAHSSSPSLNLVRASAIPSAAAILGPVPLPLSKTQITKTNIFMGVFLEDVLVRLNKCHI